MADDEITNPDNPERRGFLNKVTGVVAGCGVAAASWPFISSMNPSSDILATATAEVSLKDIEPGELKTIAWQGKPVFILRRTEEQIVTMENSTGSHLDPMPDSERVQQREWLVTIGICTHLGCVPSRNDAGWFCPCHGSIYDNSGRVLKGPAPRNLDLPPYEFASKDKIVIGNA